MKIIKYPVILAVSMLALSNPTASIAEMYVCQSKSSQNVITSRPDLYQSCKTLKGGKPYEPRRRKSIGVLNTNTNLSALSTPTITSNSRSSSIKKLTIYDRAALYCTQVALSGVRQKKDCGLLQAEGIGFINSLLIDKRFTEKQYAGMKVAVRACLDRHSYGDAIDYDGAKKCVETFRPNR